MSTNEIMLIKTDAIRHADKALRDVKKDDKSYQTLVSSIAARGLLQPIRVCEKPYRDEESGKEYQYEIIDGSHRYEAILDNGIDVIPCYIVDNTDTNIVDSIVSNVARVKQKKSDVSRAIKDLFYTGDRKTADEIADLFGFTKNQVYDYLSLNALPEQDLDSISLANALALTKVYNKMNSDDQEKFLEQAKNETAENFSKLVELWKDDQKAKKISISDIVDAEYEHKEIFSRSRLDEEKLRLETLEENADFEPMTETDKIQLELIRYIFCSSEADIAEGKAAWQEKQDKKIERIQKASNKQS